MISTVYPGASSEDVELNVTNKIEKKLKRISGIKKYTSTSSDSTSTIKIEIDPDVNDQQKVKNDIQEAVNQVSDLPADVVDKPRVIVVNSNIFPIIEVGIYGNTDYETLRESAKQFEEKLLNIPGVGGIDKFGFYDKEVKIELKPDKLEDYEMPIATIVRAIKVET